MKALIFAGNGTNCETETQYACLQAGFETADIVFFHEIEQGAYSIMNYNLLVFPGGFIDGDDLGAGKAMANRMQCAKIRNDCSFLDELFSYIQQPDRLILGICNGFQILIKLGLLPALQSDYRSQTCTLTSNASGIFEDRWVHLSVDPKSPCVFTAHIDQLFLPVRHGEGRIVTRDEKILHELLEHHQIPMFYYSERDHTVTESYPENPNGSPRGIAGICDPTGRIFGLMPHPEAYLHHTNHPFWTRIASPKQHFGVEIFRNAFQYIQAALISKYTQNLL